MRVIQTIVFFLLFWTAQTVPDELVGLEEPLTGDVPVELRSTPSSVPLLPDVHECSSPTPYYFNIQRPRRVASSNYRLPSVSRKNRVVYATRLAALIGTLALDGFQYICLPPPHIVFPFHAFW